MSTWGATWAPTDASPSTIPASAATGTIPAIRPTVRPAGPLGWEPADSGQLGFRLTDHLVPQRQPHDDDLQLTLDIPLQLPRQRGSAVVGEPAHRRIAQRWIAALLETAKGHRDRRQLDRLLARGVNPRLTALATATRPHRVHSCSPQPDLIYAAASLHLGNRVRALSTELRIDPEKSWRCTAIDLL